MDKDIIEHFPIHHGLLDISLGAMCRGYIPSTMKGVNDLEVIRGVLITPPRTREGQHAWYDKHAGDEIIFAILLHERNAEGVVIGYRYIGHTGLHNLSWPDGVASSGTIIVDKTCFGKRYGTEAKLLLLYDAFRVRGLRKVVSRVKAFNGNSWGHLLACGYQQTGRQKAHHFYNGAYVDEISFEIFRDDFERVWSTYQETKSLPRLTDEQRAALLAESILP